MLHTPESLRTVEFNVARIVDAWSNEEHPDYWFLQIDIGANLLINAAMTKQSDLTTKDLLYRRIMVELVETGTAIGRFVSMGKVLSSLTEGKLRIVEPPVTMEPGIPYRLTPLGPVPPKEGGEEDPQ